MFENNLSAILNTDGINSFSSTKTQLSPLFLAINELSPNMKFARNNLLLVGIWQGVGKPYFTNYLSCFSERMNKIRNDGVDVSIQGRFF